MSNELAQQNVLATTEDFFAALANEGHSIKGGDSKAFMKFSGDTGRYSYGAEDVEMAVGTQLVLNPVSFRRGWVVWKDGRVVKEVMTGLAEGPMPPRPNLPEYEPYKKGEGPVEQYTVEFHTTEDPFLEMIFQANNSSKRRAMGSLIKDFGASYKLHPKKWPVVEIESNTFQVKIEDSARKATKYAPKFKIITWITEEQMGEMSHGSPEDYAGGETAALEDHTEEAVVETKAAVAPRQRVDTAAKTATAAVKKGRF